MKPISVYLLLILVFAFCDFTESACEPGWEFFYPTSKCIRFFQETGNWTQSSDFCRKLHKTGNLLSIHSTAEYDIAKGLKTDQNFGWIGMVRIWDSKIGSRRMWSDLSHLNFEGPQAPDIPTTPPSSGSLIGFPNYDHRGFYYAGIPYMVTHCWGLDTSSWFQAYDCGEYFQKKWEGALCSYTP